MATSMRDLRQARARLCKFVLYCQLVGAPFQVYRGITRVLQGSGFILGGSWDLVSKVKSTLIGVISYK